jgi:hypothetical protein
MPVPPRSSVSFPIRVFIDIPSPDTLDAINALVTDANRYLGQFITGAPPLVYTFSGLPASATEGTEVWVSNGRKIGEGPGLGTGVEAYWSVGAWRVKSTDAPVQA